MLIVAIIGWLVPAVLATDEILGCGGFIKTDVQLEFSRVKVKLYTKKGVLKDSTDCAPNNGYYFLPLYDKGEYILKVEPPTGWSFDRTEIHLNVNGKTDPCSLGKDLNFHFKGFGITGQVVSVNSSNGPAGVVISYTENGKHRQTLTTVGGHFHFTPVIPGKYTIKASHSKWKLLKNEITVEVKRENTELPVNSFIVAGYDVTGKVEANDQPVDGVHFMLFSSKLKEVVAGCSVQPVTGFNENTYGRPLCNVQSKNGVFQFPTLPPGDYKLVPFYKRANAVFQIQPAALDITVGHDSLHLDKKFQLVGLSITGRVVGENVVVLLNGQTYAETDKNGQFALHQVPFGLYTLTAEARDVKYPNVKVEFSDKQFTIPTLEPNAFKSCGEVISSEPLERTLIYTESTTSVAHKTQSDPRTGAFCIYLPAGAYQVRVVPNANDAPNVQFFPLVQTIEIKNSPPSAVIFSQLKATVTGDVECFHSNECENLEITLKSVSSSQQLQAVVRNGKYRFLEVPPGRYKVFIASVGLCWENEKQQIAINSAEATVATFRQTGYKITFVTGHPTEIKCERLDETEKVDIQTLNNPAGIHAHCLQKAGRYRFTTVSCHGYEPKFVEWTTSIRSNTPVVFTAISHAHTVQVEVADSDVDIQLEMYNEQQQLVETLRPIRNKQMLEFQMQIGEREVITLVPKSDTMLFKPSKLRIVGGNDCNPTAGQLVATKGQIIEGKVIPPLAGVVVQIHVDGQLHQQIETKENGVYRFGPLDSTVQCQLSASKDNYLIDGPDSNGDFHAHKMADLLVKAVEQETGQPLAGVLVSVSGSGNYRRNLQSAVNGEVQFTSLSPDEYFMRPMMKEYRFEPTSKMVKIREGESLQLTVSGRRVAFSAFGIVRTLAGSGEAGVSVEARALPGGPAECREHAEEANSDTTGAFRVRGLRPGCSYQLQLKQADRGAAITIDNVQGDLHNLQLVSLQAPAYMDVTVHVFADKPEYYRTLRVKLGYGDQLANPIQSVRLDPQIVGNRKAWIPPPGVLVVFNSLPYDGSQYYVQLESSLSLAAHSYDTQPIYFEANTSFKHINLEFAPRTIVAEYDLHQTSVLALPLLLLFAAAVYNSQMVLAAGRSLATAVYSQVSGAVSGATAAATTTSHPSSRHGGSGADDYAEIDQIVQNINAVKQKSKKRVTLIS